MTSRILCGDARAMLATLPEKSVHCVVTSPPYWGLRNYGIAPVEWPAVTYSPMPGMPPIVDVPAMTCELGQESTPEAYIGHLVLVFREVKRVMDDSAVAFINIGDSYAGSYGAQAKREGEGIQAINLERFGAGKSVTRNLKAFGIKPKDLCGMPWRLAFAMQAEGWWLRSDIIWSKPAPMPESISDRPTRAHEYIFLLTKSASYFYDHEAIKEQSVKYENEGPRQRTKHNGLRADEDKAGGGSQCAVTETRNKRSVWTIGSGGGFADAHFATFPAEIPTIAIKAGTSERGHCPECGKRWLRTFEKTESLRDDFKGSKFDSGKTGARDGGDRTQTGDRFVKARTGWQAQCACGLSPVPDVVLDPFGGAGTTALAAERLQRDSILIELSEVYASMSRARIVGDAPLFTEIAA